MRKSKASPGGPRPPQLLVVGKGEQARVLEQFVRTHTELTQTSVDQADDFDNAQVKLAERECLCCSSREPSRMALAWNRMATLRRRRLSRL